MRKNFVSKLALVVLAGVGCLVGIAWGQNAAPSKPAPIPHKVALIDVAHIFSKYEKFIELRKDMAEEVQVVEGKIKDLMEKGKVMVGQYKMLEQGSAQAVALEKKIEQLQAEIEVEKKNSQREFYRKESKIYQTVYLEVCDMAKKYAEIYKYTMIMRFNRANDEDLGSDDPQKVQLALQRNVVYHRDEDDITEKVLRALNKEYESSAPTKTKAPAPRVGSAKEPKNN